MAVTAWDAAGAVRPVRAGHFVRLKLRVLRNNFRGQSWRIALFVVGALFGLWFAVAGFFLFAGAGMAGERTIAEMIAAFGGAVLVLGWLFLPLVFFGVDETLDPARFALLPLTRRTLVTGLYAAAAVSVPAVAMLVATSGLVLSAAGLGGWSAGLTAAVGVVAGLLLCLAASRAVTSAFATMLRSRRVRDLATILLAVFAALIGPLQIAVIVAADNTDWTRLGGVARVLGWTPLAAPYTVGFDVADGQAWAAAVKLAITAATVAVLLWWWARSLESAMLGAASSGTAHPARGPAGAPVDQLFPRSMPWLPRNRYGALVAREARYWWRDTRRRASLITFTVVGVFVPVMFNIGVDGLVEGRRSWSASLTAVTVSMAFVGILAAINLANQFGFDGTAYAANVVAGVPGRTELRARVVAFSSYLAPVLVLITVVVGLVLGRPGWIPAMIGAVAAAYGSGLAIVLFVSVFAAYALPETSNPFAVNSGAGVAKSLLSLLAMIAAAAAATPVVVAASLLGDVWLWLALPVGLAYGLGSSALGAYLAGDVLDRRMPEVLSAVTPRR